MINKALTIIITIVIAVILFKLISRLIFFLAAVAGLAIVAYLIYKAISD